MARNFPAGAAVGVPGQGEAPALGYALDLEGVSSAIIGPFTMEQALQNVQFARAYQPLQAKQRDELLAFGRELAVTLGPRYGPVA